MERKEERGGKAEIGDRKPCGFASSKFDNWKISCNLSHSSIPILENQSGRS